MVIQISKSSSPPYVKMMKHWNQWYGNETSKEIIKTSKSNTFTNKELFLTLVLVTTENNASLDLKYEINDTT